MLDYFMFNDLEFNTIKFMMSYVSRNRTNFTIKYFISFYNEQNSSDLK